MAKAPTKTITTRVTMEIAAELELWRQEMQRQTTDPISTGVFIRGLVMEALRQRRPLAPQESPSIAA